MSNCKLKSKPTKAEVEAALSSGELITQFEEMIYKMAWNFSRRFQEDLDELVALGYFGIACFAKEYDPKKSCLSTHIYRIAWHRMSNHCRNKDRVHHTLIDFQDEERPFDVPAKAEFWLTRLCSEISDEAKALIQIVLEAPEELGDTLRTSAPLTSAKALRAYMIDALDWTPEKVDTVWREVELCLS